MFERVAVTGVGIVSALGHGATSTFDALLRGESGLRPLTLFDPADTRARIAAEVRGLDAGAFAPAAEVADYSRTDAMAVVAATEALAQARAPRVRLGVSLGGTTGGMLETEQALLAGSLAEIEPERARRLLSHPLDRTTERVANALGGVSLHATLCAACSSSALAILRGAVWLWQGRADVVVAGGADGLCRLTFFGFDALGALDVEPCRPFDARRQGLGLGEGAAFLCLEREAAARARGAEILALLSGAATGAEAHHITHPEPSGARAAALVERALASAGLTARDLDYVNAHGTGTRPNDEMEARALHRALGSEISRVLVSSVKGALGHALGAAGAIEAAVSVLALERGVAPPTIGLAEPEDPALRHVIGAAVHAPLRAAASCSFGFGGTGAVLVLERADAAPRLTATPSATVPRGAHRAGKAIVVTGLAAHGPFGERSGLEVRDLLDAPALERRGALERRPEDLLDPERSRRFDATSSLVTRLAERALASAGLGGSEVAISAGTAFGSVERSVRFVLRAAERGVRRAGPAEFPQLVASAASGNASIYLGLTGAAFGIAGGDACAEAAFAAGIAWLEAGQARAVVAGAAADFDPIVAQVLGDRGRVPRSEGGGMLLIEDEAAAQARGAAPFARVGGIWELGAGEPIAAPVPLDVERAIVLSTGLDAEALGRLDASSWGACPRRSTLEVSGFHEAASAIALAVAASLVASGAADAVLTLTPGAGALWACVLERPELAR